MTTAIKRRRGTTTEHSTFVGLEGELTIDVTKDTVVVHDGSTTGGFPLLREDLSNNANVLTTTNTKTLSNKTLDLASNTVTGTLDQFNAALSDSNFVDTTSTQTIGGVKTFSSNPVLSGGTANGVLYLNGSKVATSGTALTFDGNGQVISVNSSTNALRITQTGSGNALLVEDITNPDSTPFVIDASGNVITGTTASVAFNYASTPRFEVVGTSQSSSAIATASFNGTAGAATSVLLGRGRGTVASPTTVVSGDDIGLIQFEAHDGTALIPAASILAEVDGTPGTGDMPGRLVFSTTADGASATTERMRIDSSGNLGLGVTPSAWRSSTKAIDISTYGAISQNSGGGGGVALYGNSYEDGVDTYKYKNSYYATLYRTYAGQHQWFYAPSGTAGTAITFTQAMTLDASGQLGIGTSSPASVLDVNSTAARVVDIASSNASGAYLRFKNTTTALGYLGSAKAIFGTNLADLALDVSGANNLVFGTNDTERARIDSSGNLLVGVTSATGVAKLQVSGPLRTTGYTVATLPAGTVGMITYVTDALAPSFGATVVGGGAITIPVFYNGTNWIVA